MVPYTLTDTAITVVLDFIPHVVPSSHPNWSKIIEALKQGANDNEIQTLIDIPTAISSYMQGKIEIRDRQLFFNGRILDNNLARRIMQHMNAGEEELAEPLIRFLENVMENPSFRAVEGLYEWVVKSNLPITGDGQILAWKIVREDYFSIHEGVNGRLDHSIGTIVTQDRNLCDEDPDQTCSAGIHFCSTEYLPHYGTAPGNRVVVVKVHPRDVVAFPRDYNTSKGRCCRLEVVGEVDREKVKEFFPNANVDTRFDEAEPSPERKDNFAVGQRWRTRNGEIVEITEIGDECLRSYPIETAYETYTPDGHVYLTEESDGDLMELVTEPTSIATEPTLVDPSMVAISDGGQLWYFREMVPSHGSNVAAFAKTQDDSDDGTWYFDLTTGRHFYGLMGAIRNVKPGDVPLTLGQVWRVRDGRELPITKFSGDGSIVRLGEEENWEWVFTDSGRCSRATDDHPHDLVGLVRNA